MNDVYCIWAIRIPSSIKELPFILNYTDLSLIYQGSNTAAAPYSSGSDIYVGRLITTQTSCDTNAMLQVSVLHLSEDFSFYSFLSYPQNTLFQLRTDIL